MEKPKGGKGMDYKQPRKFGGSMKPKPNKPVKKHTVASDETLSHIALKYYGSAVKDKWMIIYEANKDLIGDNPNIIRAGMELVIPDID
jgi:nucleoid-associated protein YgaU